MPAPAADLVIRYEETDENTEKIQSIATDLGFQHGQTHVHESMSESLLVFQPFEDTDQNRQLIADCMERLGAQLPTVRVSLRKTGDTKHPDDPVSIQYLVILEPDPESGESIVDVPNWL